MNAVITCTGNLHPIVSERFIKTFRKYNSIDDVIINITENNSEQFKEYFKELKNKYNATFYTYKDTYSPAALMTKRFYIYEQILLSNNYEKVFHTDARDVIFQDNIFNFKFNTDLVLFEEASLIKNEKINYEMLCKFAPEVREKTEGYPILCMGTILGTNSGFLKFINKFKDIMEKNPHIPLNYDQCILNIMARYNNMYDIPFMCCSNKNGPVNTIGLSTAFRKIDERGFLVTEDNIVSSVIHQFDRLPSKDIELLGEKQGFPVLDLIRAEQ